MFRNRSVLFFVLCKCVSHLSLSYILIGILSWSVIVCETYKTHRYHSENAIDPDIAATIDQFITVEREMHKIPGIALAVIRRGKIVFGKAYGYANVEHRVPTTLNTVFQSGSVGKQFTSMAIMMLAEREFLTLDDRINKYFTDAPVTWDNITVRHLLAHTSGMTDYASKLNLRLDYTNNEIYTIIKETPLAFEPGEKWLYSNAGYAMLGFLIERVTHRFYGDFLCDHIFRPLEMEMARIINESEIIPNRASGYVLDNDEIKNQYWVSPSLNTMADGSLYLTIYDIAKWDAALYDNRLLKRQESFDAMWTSVRLNNNTTYPYGFGWFISTAKNGMRVVEHAGAWQGFQCVIVRVPEAETTVMIFTNLLARTFDIRRIGQRVIEINNPFLEIDPTDDR